MADDVKADMEAARQSAQRFIDGHELGDFSEWERNLARAFQQLDQAAGMALAALADCEHPYDCGVYSDDGSGDMWEERCSCGKRDAIDALKAAGIEPKGGERG